MHAPLETGIDALDIQAVERAGDTKEEEETKLIGERNALKENAELMYDAVEKLGVNLGTAE